MPIAKLIQRLLSIGRPAFYAHSASAGYGMHHTPRRTDNRRGLLGLGIAAGAVLLVALVGQNRTVQPDREVAMLRHLAEDGDAGAQLQLGLAYRDGRYGLVRDSETGLYWLTQAAGNGQRYAAKLVSAASVHGQVVQDDSPANTDALNVLATRLDSPTLNVIADTWNFLTRYATAAQTADALLARAEAGNPTAEFQLGMRYRDGAWSVNRDPAAAEYWLQRAAHDGNRLAVQTLADMHHG
ncbi:MAG: sel1 repeat family protein [Gammaproteobacteria bacterium]|nr:sel1 repeat family protein [Gammaproteobacteria bacterium]